MADLLSIQTWRDLFTKHGQKIGVGLVLVVGVPMVISFGMNQFGNRNPDANVQRTLNATAFTVNDQPITQAQFVRLQQTAQGAQPGESYAQNQVGIINTLIQYALIEQEAKSRNVRPSDADIDLILAEERKARLGEKASDAEWDQYVLQVHGASTREYREQLTKEPRLLAKALIDNMKAQEEVSEQDAKNQTAEVKIALVLIPTGPQTSLPSPGEKEVKPLPDAEAKKKAEELLAKVKGGANIADIAKQNSGDFSAKQGGDVGWRAEFRSMMGGMGGEDEDMFGAIGYGKDLDEMVRKAATGQLTDVVKASGFKQGYAFAKVVERRNNLPKDFDVKKAVDELKQQKAAVKLQKMLQDKVKAAKVNFSDQDKKVYYDYGKLRELEMRQQRAMTPNPMGGAAPKPKEAPPTPEEIAKQKALVDTGFAELLKRQKDDATASLMVANQLQAKRMGKDVTQQQKDQIRDQLISLYEVVLKNSEVRQIHFQLADLYREANKKDLAIKQYSTISRILSASPAYNVQTIQEAQMVRQQLLASFKAVDQPEEAAKQQKELDRLNEQMKEEMKKQAEANKKQQEAAKAAADAAKNAPKPTDNKTPAPDNKTPAPTDKGKQ